MRVTLVGPRRPRAQVDELLGAHAPPPAELFDDHRPLEDELLTLLVVKRNGPAPELVEALDGVDQVAEEGIAPNSPSVTTSRPACSWSAHGLVHGAVLGLLELSETDAAGVQCRARLDKVRRPQETAHHVAPDSHGLPLLQREAGGVKA